MQKNSCYKIDFSYSYYSMVHYHSTHFFWADTQEKLSEQVSAYIQGFSVDVPFVRRTTEILQD